MLLTTVAKGATAAVARRQNNNNGNHHQNGTGTCRLMTSPPSSTARRSRPTGNPRAAFHMRRSELAGWRTKSLLRVPRSPYMFLPIIKLRGLPYFCTWKHVMEWFGSLAPSILSLIVVPEVQPLSSGFALVVMKSSRAALEAWKSLHKGPITNRRFVEVFGLVPPHCPLVRRGALDKSGNPASVPPIAGAAFASREGITCSFCGAPLGSHADGGLASSACARMRYLLQDQDNYMQKGYCPQALMPCAFLEVPALLYTEGTTREEVMKFRPRSEGEPGVYSFAELAQSRGIILDPSAAAAANDSSHRFFDLTRLEGYDLRNLLCEILQCIMHWVSQSGMSCVTIATIGSLLSTKARAYLFIVETKLQAVLERFPKFFHCEFYQGTIRVRQLPCGLEAIRNMPSYTLSSRRRRQTQNDAYLPTRSRPLPYDGPPTADLSNEHTYVRLLDFNGDVDLDLDDFTSAQHSAFSNGVPADGLHMEDQKQAATSYAEDIEWFGTSGLSRHCSALAAFSLTPDEDANRIGFSSREHNGSALPLSFYDETEGRRTATAAAANVSLLSLSRNFSAHPTFVGRTTASTETSTRDTTPIDQKCWRDEEEEEEFVLREGLLPPLGKRSTTDENVVSDFLASTRFANLMALDNFCRSVTSPVSESHSGKMAGCAEAD